MSKTLSNQNVTFNEEEFPFKAGFLNNYAPEKEVIVHNSEWSQLPIIQFTKYTQPKYYVPADIEQVPASQLSLGAPSATYHQQEAQWNPVSEDPKTLEEALNSPVWNPAMNSEITALKNNKTWTLVPRLDSYNVVGNKWVHRIKRNADGSVKRYKARLVAKGFHQSLSVDFYQTFSPVIKASTIRIVLTIAVSKGLKIKQLDVNNAFLNGQLEEDVYMVQPQGKPLSKFDGEALSNPTVYRSAIGALQYLCHTRPDIAFAVNKLSQFLQAPTTSHWSAVKKVLRYLKGTIHHGLHIGFSDHLGLVGYSDVDWACCLDDRRSIAEYRALAHVAFEITWIESLLKELKFKLPSTPITWCDSQSASALASNPVYHVRTKHIEIDVHFVRDKVLKKELEIYYIPSSDQITVCLTKGLTHSRFQYQIDKLGVKAL
uniref:Reverse transcriptase Ty1/copia-type domain-containing protein n=1 Tax=Cannabis sativa TaxID=3483 RepID=A0A803QFQ1_CANSA